MTATAVEIADLASRAAAVGAAVVGPAADDVDRLSRFPTEAMQALRAERMLSMLAPVEVGGTGATVTAAGEVVFELARQCTSTGMIVAMHELQVACLARHGGDGALRGFLGEVVERQLLLASATSEKGTGGDLRSSVCAVGGSGDDFTLERDAIVVSYGLHADAVLATARATSASPPNDQVLVVCKKDDTSLDETSPWDALGMRGTCSAGFLLRAAGDRSCILPEPFSEIAARTMLPVSHALWGFVWLGAAAAAVDKAQSYVQAEARRQPGSRPPAALRLAELVTLYQQLEEIVRSGARRFDEHSQDPDELATMSFAVAMNSLKVSTTTLVIEIVTMALRICGIAAYREGGPFSLGRVLRDVHGAPLMVNNDRLLDANAQLLLVHRATG